MYIIEWLYSHIIRATGVSFIGTTDVFKAQNKSDYDAIKQENEAYRHIAKRLFVLIERYTSDKIANIEKNKSKKAQEIIKRLRKIQEDCKKIIAEFEKYED